VYTFVKLLNLIRWSGMIMHLIYKRYRLDKFRIRIYNNDYLDLQKNLNNHYYDMNLKEKYIT
jgi:hypothetical protein